MYQLLRTNGTVPISSTRGNFSNDEIDRNLQLRWKICEQTRLEYESEMQGITINYGRQENDDDDRGASFSFTASAEESINPPTTSGLQGVTRCERFHALATKPTLNFWVSSLPVKNSRIHAFNTTRQRYPWI